MALDLEAEMGIAESSFDLECSYGLPDDNVITVGSERFRCAKVLFQPSLIGTEASVCHDTTGTLQYRPL